MSSGLEGAMGSEVLDQCTCIIKSVTLKNCMTNGHWFIAQSPICLALVGILPFYYVLRSAVGKTHVLRLRLVMNYTTSHFPLIVLGYPLDSKQSSLP